jgi:hypothetical protein
MTERPLSEAELDAQLDAIEGLLGPYPAALLALQQIRAERAGTIAWRGLAWLTEVLGGSP